MPRIKLGHLLSLKVYPSMVYDGLSRSKKGMSWIKIKVPLSSRYRTECEVCGFVSASIYVCVTLKARTNLAIVPFHIYEIKIMIIFCL